MQYRDTAIDSVARAIDGTAGRVKEQVASLRRRAIPHRRMKSKRRWVAATVVAAIAVCIAVVRLLHPVNEAQPPLEETPLAAVSAVETAEAMTPPEIGATTDVLILMPMAWFDDFEIPAIRQGFRRYPHVAVIYAGPQLGTATSHEGTVDVEIDVAIEIVDPITYDAYVICETEAI